MNEFSYKGISKTKNYFEGWYLKVVDDKNNNNYAIIFGISLYEKDPHSFIQIIDESEINSHYYRFDIKDFFYNRESIMIKENMLGINKLKINVGDFIFDLDIKPSVQLKKYGLTNNAMGCFKLLPLCTYHEIVFMNSKVEGTITTSKNSVKCLGTGYMEKNYGMRFPKKWLWIQSNHFQNHNINFVLAVADIFKEIKGFFCILNVNGEEFRFATYNCSKVTLTPSVDGVNVILEKNKALLIIQIKNAISHTLIAPTKKSQMNKEISESLNSTLTLSLYEDGELLLEDTATNVGYENLYTNIEYEKN